MNAVTANLFGFLIFQSVPTIAYIVINYRLLKNMLAPQKISIGYYLATILPIIILTAFYFSYDLDKAGKWVGLALLIYGLKYLAIIATLHAVILLLTRQFRKSKIIWIGTFISANGIAYLVAIFATWVIFIGLGAIVSFFDLV